MATTVVNTLKTKTCLLNFMLGDVGRNGPIYGFDICHKTRSNKLFHNSLCLESFKKFKVVEGKLVKKDGTVVRLKTNPQHMISVINSSNEIVPMKLYDAEKLAEAKGLNLIKLKVHRSHKLDRYEMVTDQELMEIENDKLKQFVFKSRINENHLAHKIRHIVKALEKKGSVQISLKLLDSDEKENALFMDKVKNYLKTASFPIEINQFRDKHYFKSFIVKKIDGAAEEKAEGDEESEKIN